MNKRFKSREQNVAEAEIKGFQKDMGPFVVAAETTRMAMIFTDAKESENPIIFANDSFLALTGYSREEILGKNFSALVVGHDPETLEQVKTAFDENSHSSPEIRCYRKDGSVFIASVFINPVRNENGEIVQYFSSFMDVTHRKQEIDNLRYLLDELNHRTQNTLSTVLAIARQTLHGTVEKDVVMAFEGRIVALSKAHSLLGRKNWSRISIRDIINQILPPFGLNDRQDNHFLVKGDDVRLQPKAALSLAMMFHELATNAEKHGALSNNAGGHISITWKVDKTPQGDQMQLCWKESDGPSVVLPQRHGFGVNLIEDGLAQDLNGEVSLNYDPAGVVCRVVMPVAESERAGAL